MKRTNRIISTLVILAIFIASLSIVAYAAYDNRVVEQEYSIPTGETVWDGKDKGIFFGFSSTAEVRLNVSIRNEHDREIDAEMKRVKKWGVDPVIKEISDFEGSNYDWRSVYFTPDTSYTYYMRITSTSTSGVNGRYSCDQ